MKTNKVLAEGDGGLGHHTSEYGYDPEASFPILKNKFQIGYSIRFNLKGDFWKNTEIPVLMPNNFLFYFVRYWPIAFL
jgi:hypothetical protein